MVLPPQVVNKCPPEDMVYLGTSIFAKRGDKLHA